MVNVNVGLGLEGDVKLKRVGEEVEYIQRN